MELYNILSIWIGKNEFSLNRTPMDLEHLLVIWEMCSRKLRFLSMIKPRNLALFASLMMLLPILMDGRMIFGEW